MIKTKRKRLDIYTVTTLMTSRSHEIRNTQSLDTHAAS